MDEDFALALQIQLNYESDLSKVHISPQSNASSTHKYSTKKKNEKHSVQKNPSSLIDPEWELIDPTPDIHALFEQFDKQFFWNKLQGVVVKWSPRMTSCAGICVYEGRGGLCSVRLSGPLLKLRPRKDLVETLLHEMIHAYLFVTCNNKDRDGHGPEFQLHMHRINKEASTNITIYHNFHEEVAVYKTHWWRCNGPCQRRPPYFGMIRRASNRAPAPHDFWWDEHQASCGGTFLKVREPEGYSSKKARKTVGSNAVGSATGINDIRTFLTPNTPRSPGNTNKFHISNFTVPTKNGVQPHEFPSYSGAQSHSVHGLKDISKGSGRDNSVQVPPSRPGNTNKFHISNFTVPTKNDVKPHEFPSDSGGQSHSVHGVKDISKGSGLDNSVKIPPSRPGNTNKFHISNFTVPTKNGVKPHEFPSYSGGQSHSVHGLKDISKGRGLDNSVQVPPSRPGNTNKFHISNFTVSTKDDVKPEFPSYSGGQSHSVHGLKDISKGNGRDNSVKIPPNRLSTSSAVKPQSNIHGFGSVQRPKGNVAQGSKGGVLANKGGGTLVVTSKGAASRNTTTQPSERHNYTPFGGKGHVLGGSSPIKPLWMRFETGHTENNSVVDSRMMPSDFKEVLPNPGTSTNHSSKAISSPAALNVHLNVCVQRNPCKRSLEAADDCSRVGCSDDSVNADVKPKKSNMSYTQTSYDEPIVHLSMESCPLCDAVVEQSLLAKHIENCAQGVFNDSLIEIDDSDTDDDDNNDRDRGAWPCPCCMKVIQESEMNSHLDQCLSENVIKELKEMGELN